MTKSKTEAERLRAHARRSLEFAMPLLTKKPLAPEGLCR